jgi:hypothetical protein
MRIGSFIEHKSVGDFSSVADSAGRKCEAHPIRAIPL